MTPEVVDMEERLGESLGTRVQIEPRERGGRISIDYFSHEELLALSLTIRKAGEEKTHKGMFDTLRDEDMETLQAVSPTPRHIEPITEFTHLNSIEVVREVSPLVVAPLVSAQILTTSEAIELDEYVSNEVPEIPEVAEDDRSVDEVKEDEQNEDLYNVKNFALQLQVFYDT